LSTTPQLEGADFSADAAALLDGVDTPAEFERLRRQFDAGHRQSALTAIQFAWMLRAPVPDWALAVIGQAVRDWNGAEFRTLDEALGVQRPKGWRMDAARRAQMLGGAIFVGVNQLLAAGEPYSDDVFAAIGARWGVGKTAAKEIYYGELDYLQAFFPQHFGEPRSSREKQKKPALRKRR
jgi:hypothetical protein